MKLLGIIGGGVGLLLLVMIVLIVTLSGGESGRRAALNRTLGAVIQQCGQFPDGSAAAYYIAPNVRAQYQAAICQINANTQNAIANADATPEYGVGDAHTALIQASGATPDSCSTFQDANATAIIIGCAMIDPATNAEAMYINFIQNPGGFPPTAAAAP